MERKKLLLIVNLRAGKMVIRDKLVDIIDKYCSAGYEPTVRMTQARNDAVKLVAECDGDYEMIVCAGGDGTLNETITGMMQRDEKIPLGYIPCGSTNDMANTLGLPHDLIQAANLTIEESPKFQDVGRFNDDRYFTYTASFGAFTKTSYSTPQNVKNKIGHLAYILGGAREIKDIKPHHFKVTFNNQTIEDDFVFGNISNSTSLGGVFHFPASEVNLNDGKFELFLVRAPKKASEYGGIVNSIMKQQYDNKYIVFGHTDHAAFESDEELVWTIDGEATNKVNNVEIQNISNVIKLVKTK